MEFEIENKIHTALHTAVEFVHDIICLDISNNNNGIVKLQLFVTHQKYTHYMIFWHIVALFRLNTLYFTLGNLLKIYYFVIKLLISQTSAAKSTIHGCSSIKECASEDKKKALIVVAVVFVFL